MPGFDYSYGAYGSGGREVVYIVPARHRVAHPARVPGMQGADEESKVYVLSLSSSLPSLALPLSPVLLCTYPYRTPSIPPTRTPSSSFPPTQDMDAAALSAADEEALAEGPKLARAVPVSAVVA